MLPGPRVLTLKVQREEKSVFEYKIEYNATGTIGVVDLAQNAQASVLFVTSIASAYASKTITLDELRKVANCYLQSPIILKPTKDICSIINANFDQANQSYILISELGDGKIVINYNLVL